MTWNMENLFDVGDEAGRETQAQLAAKIESLRAVIESERCWLRLSMTAIGNA
jgi:hypothetical protein